MRTFGDVWAWSGHGLEHKNFQMKKVARGTCQPSLEVFQRGGKKSRDGTQQYSKTIGGRVSQNLEHTKYGEKYGGRSQHSAASKRNVEAIS